MSAVTPASTSASSAAKTTSNANHADSHNHGGAGHVNGHSHHTTASGSASSKKAKGKKAPDPNEAKKLIAARIEQLELDADKDKEQEAEIEREVKKATRELDKSLSKHDDLAKIDMLQKRCGELLAQMKRLERDNTKNKKRGDQLQKDKDHGRSELSRTKNERDRLDKLARDLSNGNNRLKAENKTLQDESKINHEQWDVKYEDVLWQLQDLQEEKDNPRTQVVNIEVEQLYVQHPEEYDSFSQRFKSLIEQYEMRDLHFHSQMRTKELEVQLHMARLEHQRKITDTEAAKARALASQVNTFKTTETELRNQLSIYVDKFKQVEDTLNNSNDLFLTFRREMEHMGKKTKRLEKENEVLTKKNELGKRNIVDMVEDRTKNFEEIDTLKKKTEKLTTIIKQMQKQGRKPTGSMLEDGSKETEDLQYSFDEDGSEYEFEDEEGSDPEAVYEEETDDDLNLESQHAGPARPPETVTGTGTNGTGKP